MVDSSITVIAAISIVVNLTIIVSRCLIDGAAQVAGETSPTIAEGKKRIDIGPAALAPHWSGFTKVYHRDCSIASWNFGKWLGNDCKGHCRCSEQVARCNDLIQGEAHVSRATVSIVVHNIS